MDPDCKTAFQILKTEFTSKPVLMLPCFTEPFRIECNASDYATGAILSQEGSNQKWHPVAYFSKALTEPERNYDIYD